MSDPIDPNPNTSAFWMPVAALRRGKKVRADAVLKNLSSAAHQQIVQWCKQPVERDEEGKPIKGSGGVEFALAQLAEVARRCSLPALAVSSDTLYKFLSWWELEEDLDMSSELEAQVFAKTGDKKAAREAAEVLLLRIGMARKDAKLITAATMAEDSRRNLDLMEKSGETKAQQKARQLEQKDRDYALAEKKFQRDSCKLFLKWFDVESAKKIATSGMSNTEKIEQLGLAMFGEDWKA